jgi:hypothetical protein
LYKQIQETEVDIISPRAFVLLFRVITLVQTGIGLGWNWIADLGRLSLRLSSGTSRVKSVVFVTDFFLGDSSLDGLI